MNETKKTKKAKPLTEWQRYALSEAGAEWNRHVHRLMRQSSYKRLPLGVRIKIDAAAASTVLYALRLDKRYK